MGCCLRDQSAAFRFKAKARLEGLVELRLKLASAPTGRCCPSDAERGYRHQVTLLHAPPNRRSFIEIFLATRGIARVIARAAKPPREDGIHCLRAPPDKSRESEGACRRRESGRRPPDPALVCGTFWPRRSRHRNSFPHR